MNVFYKSSTRGLDPHKPEGAYEDQHFLLDIHTHMPHRAEAIRPSSDKALKNKLCCIVLGMLIGQNLFFFMGRNCVQLMCRAVHHLNSLRKFSRECILLDSLPKALNNATISVLVN